MVTVSEAKKRINQVAGRMPVITVPLLDALGMTLAVAVEADLDVPPFDQSAMDGYALRFATESGEASSYQVVGEIPAGSAATGSLGPGEAMRIFTGAPVPHGADTVVMQEKVQRQGNALLLEDPLLKKGSNVRPKGSQTQKGDLALPAGTVLNPGAIGFLAGLGVTEVKVWAQPKVCLLVTGNELAPPGTPLLHGQVYESNSYALIAALRAMNIQPTEVHRCKDDERQITAHLAQGIEQCDLVIVTGGISVGDYDLVKKSMDHCEVETVFYKVKQKPGKPLFFGKKGHVLLFGLPGNPAAVLTCFYEYIAPLLHQWNGQEPGGQIQSQAMLTQGFVKKEGLTYFLKGRTTGDIVVPLDAQESYQMNSFARANCLIVLEEQRTSYEKGEWVELHLF